MNVEMKHTCVKVLLALVIAGLGPIACGEAADHNDAPDPQHATATQTDTLTDTDTDTDTATANDSTPPAQAEATDELVKAVREKAAGGSTFTPATLESLIARLETLDLSVDADREVLDATKKFVAGDLQPTVYAGYLKTVLLDPWKQKLAWLTARAKQGDGWACFYLVTAHSKKLTRTPYVSPLENVPAPESARPYWQACNTIVHAKGFTVDWSKMDDWSKLMDAMELADKAKHAPTIVLSTFIILNANVPFKPEPAHLAKRIKETLPSKHPVALAANGWVLMYGIGVEADPAAGVKLVQQAIEGGSGWAKLLMGHAYLGGVGVEQDLALAARYFQQSADAGETSALAALAAMHENGQHFPKSQAEAIAIYRKAADQGSGYGNRKLGWSCYNGDGVEQDKAAAAQHWLRGADAGDSECLRLAGWALAHGVGVKKNLGAARRVYYPMHYRAIATWDGVSAWADRYNKVEWVTSQELLNLVKNARLEVNIADDILRYYSRAKIEAAITDGVKARSINIDPKASAAVVVDITGKLKQDDPFNRALVVCKLVLPATALRATGHVAFDSVAHGNQQVHQMPQLLVRGVNDTLFYNQVRRFISATLTGDSKSVALKENRGVIPDDPQARWMAYLDFHAAQAIRTITAQSGWASLPSMAPPRVRYSGDLGGIDIDALQQHWSRELTAKGVKFNPNSTTRVDHLVIVVTNSHTDKLKHFASVVTVRDGNVMYEIDGRYVRHTGWVLHKPQSSVSNGSPMQYLTAFATEWSAAFAKQVRPAK